jgi:tetratricopeptide (TPR) repeat protein
MKKTIIISLIIVLSNFAKADSLNYYFSEANNLYQKNEFAEAINLYNKILNQKQESYELYFNLGNSYFKNNQVAKSILYFEKALKLKPNDEDIKYNIQYANLYIKDDISASQSFILDRIYNNFLFLFSSNTWAIISIGLFVISLSIFIVFLFSKVKLKRKIAFFSSIFLIIFSAITMFFSADLKNYISKPNSAIIMETVTLKGSPDNTGTDLLIINPGIKVTIKNNSNNWYEVKLPNGKVGWINNKFVEII